VVLQIEDNFEYAIMEREKLYFDRQEIDTDT
jgi:hypothetical protein